MGLSKLLAVSRSVRSVTGQPARYKMTQQNLLPSFGGTKAAEAAPVEEAPPSGLATPDPATVEPATARPKPEPTTTVAPGSGPGDAKAAEFVEATKKLRPFGGGWWFKNPFARTSGPAPEKRPVQTELSLDTVRPVRNDLSDSEVELGRSRETIPPEPTKAPITTPAPPAAAAGGWWQRLKTRLFGGNDEN